MARKWRIRYAGARYHVTSRGNGRDVIFYSDDDMARFMEQLDVALESDNVVLYAYCLMPNHYHLLVETPNGNIQKFMHRLNTAYSLYFRYKNHRPGHCFETRYHAKLAGGDEYLLRLTRYIHLNPVKVKAMGHLDMAERKRVLDGYKWSSYAGYVGARPAEDRVNYEWLSLMGRRTRSGEHSAYRRYVEGFLLSQDEVLKEALGLSSYAIGDKRFRDEMEDGLDGVRLEKGCSGDIVWPEGKTVTEEVIERDVVKAFGVSKEALHMRGGHRAVARLVAMELCCQLTGKSQRALADYFGYTSESAIGKQRKVLSEMMAAGDPLRRKVDKLKKALMA